MTTRQVQKWLNDNGYAKPKLSLDGDYGPKTKAAIKNFQKKNKLKVTGKVGDVKKGIDKVKKDKKKAAQKKAENNRQKKLQSVTNKITKDLRNAKPTPKTEFSKELDKSYAKQDTLVTKLRGQDPGKYKESAEVGNLRAALENLERNQPKEYVSNYKDQIQGKLNDIMNRQSFSYDMNADPLYQQYKDQYIKQGQTSMMDTMGQAAALTGGYGSSYAVTAGNQAYQNHLSELNNIVPELYQNAYGRYKDEGQNLYDQMGLLQGLETTDYGRYRDTVTDYMSNREHATGRYQNAQDTDLRKYDTQVQKWLEQMGIETSTLNNLLDKRASDNSMRFDAGVNAATMGAQAYLEYMLNLLMGQSDNAFKLK